MKKVSLAHMKAGSKGRLIEVDAGALLQSRLNNMGLHPGRSIVKISHLGLRGPVMVKVGRSTVAIGHGVAHKIIVEAE